MYIRGYVINKRIMEIYTNITLKAFDLEELALKKQRPLIGILVNELDRQFFTRALYYMQMEFFAADMDVAIFSTLLTRDEDTYISLENAVFDLINYDALDGIILFRQTFNSDDVRRRIDDLITNNCKKPVVVFEDSSDRFESLLFDNDEGAQLIADHLVGEHGVKSVAYVSGPEGSAYHQSIENCFHKAFAKYGIELGGDNVYYGPDWQGDYSQIVSGLVDGGLPDAVVCCSDFTASNIIGGLSAAGVKIPSDVIVTGYSKGEPFNADYFNITSVSRDPKDVSIKTARHIIAKIKGIAPEDEEFVSCLLEKGVTCGCEEINFPTLAKMANENMIQTRCEGFDSYYNFMSEELIGAVDFEDYLWKLNWYTIYLGETENFWLCLNHNIMHEENDPTGFTEKLDVPYMKLDGKSTVDFDRRFDRSLMLPYIFEERSRPEAFIFTSLHFSETNFGYSVLSYGSSGKLYDSTFGKWLRYVTCALEKHRRHIIYQDAVTDAQIRDPLTGLLNMKGFKSIMTDRLAKSASPDKLLRILSIDVENLAGINTAYGFSEGDRLLQRLGVILNNCAGDDDICVRVSGDEFLIAGILDANVPVDEVPVNLERNLAAYNSSTASEYGIHLYTSRVTAPFTSAEILDTLPYEATYQRTLTKDNHNKSKKISSSAARADFDPEERKYVSKMLNDNLITYHFQPIVDAKTGEIFAYEALMRSDGEMKISPVAILDHAEALGRLADVERCTMTNLFDYLYNHQDKFLNKRLFVNSIPSCILSDTDFNDLYAKYGSIMDKVVVEFTEQTEASAEQLETIIDRSKRMGFKIAIDDYGTGYSNISNLLTFMPNCVKIDRSLIMNIHEDKRKQHFTQNIIDYAHDNDFKVLAEGVEKAEELKMVISMGIDLIQGYFTARPAPEPIEEINNEVAEEIKEMNRMTEQQRIKKTYFTGTEDEVSLIALDFDNYTDIFISKEHFTLIGASNHISDAAIRIMDGLECTLDLKNVAMRNDHTEACITLGSKSKLTLNICGSVSISGAINVPENAELKIVGDGSLSIESSSNQTYCIGSNVSNSYGDIGIYLKNKLLIHLDSDKCTAIGGGYNNMASRIDIQTNEMVIELSGNTVLGIGCQHSVALVNIRDTDLRFVQQCANGICIGSYEKSVDMTMNNSSLYVESSGNNIGGICAFNVKGNAVNINDSKLDMTFKGKNIHGIGSDDGELFITMHNDDIQILCEGARAIAMGSDSPETKIAMYNCKGLISVVSGKGNPLDVAESNLIFSDCDMEIRSNE